MIGPIVKSAIGDEDIRWSPLLLGPTLLVLLRSDHYEGKLSSRLPNLILLSDLLCVRRPITSPLVIARLRLLSVVYFVTIVVSATVHSFVLFLSLGDSAFRQNVEASLRFSYQLPVLVLLEAHVLLLYLLLSRLVAFVHRLGVHPPVEALGSEHLVQLLLALSVYVDLSGSVELIGAYQLLSVLPPVSWRVVYVRILLAILSHRLWLLLSRSHALDLYLVFYVIVR